MSNNSYAGHAGDLLPTHNSRGPPNGARMRQAHADDIEDESEARYYFEPRKYQTASAQNLEWHGIELTPMLGAVLLCIPFALWAIWAALH